MSYTISLTPKERNDLAWLADRGYDCGLFGHLEPQYESEDGIYTIPEHKVWDIAEQNVDHGAWTCLAWNSPLGEKISAFLESIV